MTPDAQGHSSRPEPSPAGARSAPLNPPVCGFCEREGIVGNPHEPIHPAWAGVEHVAWDDGYSAATERLLALLGSDEATEAVASIVNDTILMGSQGATWAELDESERAYWRAKCLPLLFAVRGLLAGTGDTGRGSSGDVPSPALPGSGVEEFSPMEGG